MVNNTDIIQLYVTVLTVDLCLLTMMCWAQHTERLSLEHGGVSMYWSLLRKCVYLTFDHNIYILCFLHLKKSSDSLIINYYIVKRY